jgi:hypothetical protein
MSYTVRINYNVYGFPDPDEAKGFADYWEVSVNPTEEKAIEFPSTKEVYQSGDIYLISDKPNKLSNQP